MTSIGGVEQAIEQFARGSHSARTRCVVAVSGGVDSVVLATAMHRAQKRVLVRPVIAHFSHLTRTPEEHAADLKAAERVAADCNAPLYVATAAEYTRGIERSGGPESRAREARYGFLMDVCRASGSSVLLTAHTLDDQIETVVMRLLAGIDSRLLAGIEQSATRGEVRVVRPFLSTRKSQILEYAERHSLRWNEDRTNQENYFRRNVVRNLILPAAREAWPVIENDLIVLSQQMVCRTIDIRESARAIPRSREGSAMVIDAPAFFTSSTDVRLDLLYEVVRDLGLLDRRDRPSRRFFAPLLDRRPERRGILLQARGIQVSLQGERLVVSPVLSGGDNLGIFGERGGSLTNEGRP